jgi:hypothetical protein
MKGGAAPKRTPTAPQVYNIPSTRSSHAPRQVKQNTEEERKEEEKCQGKGAMQEAHCHACQMWVKQEDDVLACC